MAQSSDVRLVTESALVDLIVQSTETGDVGNGATSASTLALTRWGPFVVGAFNVSLSGTAGTIFTIPDEYAPTADTVITLNSDNTTVFNFVVHSDGTITLIGSNTSGKSAAGLATWTVGV